MANWEKNRPQGRKKFITTEKPNGDKTDDTWKSDKRWDREESEKQGNGPGAGWVKAEIPGGPEDKSIGAFRRSYQAYRQGKGALKGAAAGVKTGKSKSGAKKTK